MMAEQDNDSRRYCRIQAELHKSYTVVAISIGRTLVFVGYWVVEMGSYTLHPS